MKQKSLIETNPYLKDPEMRKKLVSRSVRTSCAVEGIQVIPLESTPISEENDKIKDPIPAIK